MRYALNMEPQSFVVSEFPTDGTELKKGEIFLVSSMGH